MSENRTRQYKRPPQREVNGILLLDKAEGISSNRALQQVKALFNARKAGHTGNLDVLASGLLPVCFGQATKVCGFLLESDKRYSAQFKLGERTTTGDREGQVTATRPLVDIDEISVLRHMAEFHGAIEQIPPMYSALKRDGQPLYKLARKGIVVERESRTVTIHRFHLDYLNGHRLGVEVECTKGTYIRTLAEDLGESLGCGAHVTQLRRLGAGPFDINDAYSYEQLQSLGEGGYERLDELLLPLDSALGSLPKVSLSDDAAFYLNRGQAVRVTSAPLDGLLRIYDGQQRFIGIGEVLNDGRIAPRRLFQNVA